MSGIIIILILHKKIIGLHVSSISPLLVSMSRLLGLRFSRMHLCNWSSHFKHFAIAVINVQIARTRVFSHASLFHFPLFIMLVDQYLNYINGWISLISLQSGLLVRFIMLLPVCWDFFKCRMGYLGSM
jgi:hypothetical protein